MPSFVKSPEDQTGISGGVASFVCQAVGEPKPRITWMKKGKKVSSQRFEVCMCYKDAAVVPNLYKLNNADPSVTSSIDSDRKHLNLHFRIMLLEMLPYCIIKPLNSIAERNYIKAVRHSVGYAACNKNNIHPYGYRFFCGICLDIKHKIFVYKTLLVIY